MPARADNLAACFTQFPEQIRRRFPCPICLSGLHDRHMACATPHIEESECNSLAHLCIKRSGHKQWSPSMHKQRLE